MNDKNCRAAKLFVSIKNANNLSFRQFSFLLSTGTRIRTQIKGFGDPYATVAPYPFVKKAIDCDGFTFSKYNLLLINRRWSMAFYWTVLLLIISGFQLPDLHLRYGHLRG